jgi:hypothetical protein
MFRSTTVIRELAKVTLMIKQSVKLRRYVLCGGVAACYVQVWFVCCVMCRVSLALPPSLKKICKQAQH